VKEKYSRLTFKVLILIPIIFILFAADQFILPQKQIKDYITEYSKIILSRRGKFSTSSSKEFLGYKYYTQEGYQFTLSKTYIEENEIFISQSYIFQNISNVKTINKEYSEELISGLNGVCLYIAIGLFATSIISLLLLKFNPTLTENGFHNIVLSNAFLTIIFFYLLFVYN
jgi:hypothetical protein